MKTITHAAERGTATDHSISRTAAGAVALGAVFTLPVAVDAAVVYSGPMNISATLSAGQRIASLNTGEGDGTATAPLDIDGNAIPDFAIGVRQMRSSFEGDVYRRGHADLIPAAPGNGVMVGLSTFDGGEGPLAVNFPASSHVGSEENFSGKGGGVIRNVAHFYGGGSSSDSTVAGLPNSVTGVAGIRFQRPGSTTNASPTTHYGWIRLHVGDGPEGFPVSVTAIDWAWENTPDTAIHVPSFQAEIPEANPALALLAAGGTGLVAWRLRRRKEAKQAAQS